MKKTVILTIFVVYIASICIVGFYGAKIRVYDEKIKAEKVVCNEIFNDDLTDEKLENATSVNVRKETTLTEFKNQEYDYVFIRRIKNQDFKNGYVLPLKFGVYPENATDALVDYGDLELIQHSYPQGTPLSEIDEYSFVDNGDGSVTFTFVSECFAIFNLRPSDKTSSNSVKVLIWIQGTDAQESQEQKRR